MSALYNRRVSTPPSVTSIDRRRRKTRAALQAALLELIGVQRYDTITVDDIVNTADVARATFYAHYPDKDHLLAAVTQQLMEELASAVSVTTWRNPPTYSGSGIKP